MAILQVTLACYTMDRESVAIVFNRERNDEKKINRKVE